jgi:hypothetical protein
MRRFMCALGVVALLALGQAANAAPIRGTTIIKDTVQAEATDTHRIACEGGEDAAVLVMGDGDTKLVLTVHDENGNLIGRDSGRNCLVRWKPKRDGLFVIQVRNLGKVTNEYVLLTN